MTAKAELNVIAKLFVKTFTEEGNKIDLRYRPVLKLYKGFLKCVSVLNLEKLNQIFNIKRMTRYFIWKQSNLTEQN
jgi:hypothetical protein